MRIGCRGAGSTLEGCVDERNRSNNGSDEIHPGTAKTQFCDCGAYSRVRKEYDMPDVEILHAITATTQPTSKIWRCRIEAQYSSMGNCYVVGVGLITAKSSKREAWSSSAGCALIRLLCRLANQGAQGLRWPTHLDYYSVYVLSIESQPSRQTWHAVFSNRWERM